MGLAEGLVDFGLSGLDPDFAALGIASRALTQRFISTCSIWPRSASTRGRSLSKRTDSSIWRPMTRRSSLMRSEIRLLISSGSGW
jgi:hypothetical protein